MRLTREKLPCSSAGSVLLLLRDCCFVAARCSLWNIDVLQLWEVMGSSSISVPRQGWRNREDPGRKMPLHLLGMFFRNPSCWRVEVVFAHLIVQVEFLASHRALLHLPSHFPPLSSLHSLPGPGCAAQGNTELIGQRWQRGRGGRKIVTCYQTENIFHIGRGTEVAKSRSTGGVVGFSVWWEGMEPLQNGKQFFHLPSLLSPSPWALLFG